MPRSQGKKFSMVSLHNKLDETLIRLNKEAPTKKRDELIDLVKGLRASTKCPQIMLITMWP
jgi:hypothetical protein